MKIVIPAAGAGLRFGGEKPKQFVELGGVPVLRRVLLIFDALESVTEIAVAVPRGYLNEVEGYGISKLRYVISGDKSRAESVFAALKCFEKCLDKEVILIHDGSRPFVTPEIIEAVADATKEFGAAVACCPVVDTIKQADMSGHIAATPDRSSLWAAQTPQGFTYAIISRAYAAAFDGNYLQDATDDSSLVERLGIPVKIVPSNPANYKITTKVDLLRMGESFD